MFAGKTYDDSDIHELLTDKEGKLLRFNTKKKARAALSNHYRGDRSKLAFMQMMLDKLFEDNFITLDSVDKQYSPRIERGLRDGRQDSNSWRNDVTYDNVTAENWLEANPWAAELGLIASDLRLRRDRETKSIHIDVKVWLPLRLD